MPAEAFRNAAIAGVVLWFLLWIVHPGGLFLVDESVQIGALAGLAGTGTPILQNGFDVYGSADLLIVYFREGPHGAAAQYPSGFTYLALPFYMLGGVKGVMLLNLLAGLASVALTYGIVARLSGRAVARGAALILMFATFLIDYGLAVWPHSVALALMLATILCAISAESEDGDLRPWRALLGGVFFGAAMTVRYDALLILPAVALWILIYARRPYATGVLAAVGVIPGIASLCWSNMYKFGTLNPLSYGVSDGGGIDPTTHAPLLLAIAAGAVGVIGMREVPALRKPLLGLGVVAVAAALIISPQLQAAASRFVGGFYVLIIDLSAHKGIGQVKGHEVTAEGYVTFFNIFKKALGQSLPWIGLLPLLAVDARSDRRGIILSGLICLFVALPFLPRQWHGGYSMNMRYFLPMLPFLSYLVALGLVRIGRTAPADTRQLFVTVVFTAAGILGLLMLTPGPGRNLVEHGLPPWVLLAGIVISLVAVRRPSFRPIVWSLAAITLTWAAISAYFLDVGYQGSVRAFALSRAAAYEAVPSNSVVYENLASALPSVMERDDVLAAVSGTVEGGVDKDFVERALDDGLAIVIANKDLQDQLRRTVPEVQEDAFPLDGLPDTVIFRRP